MRICRECGCEEGKINNFLKLENLCTTCRSKISKVYRESNREKVAKIKKNYSENNKEKIAEYQREYGKEYYNNNKEKILQRNKEYRENNKEKCSKLRKESYERCIRKRMKTTYKYGADGVLRISSRNLAAGICVPHSKMLVAIRTNIVDIEKILGPIIQNTYIGENSRPNKEHLLTGDQAGALISLMAIGSGRRLADLKTAVVKETGVLAILEALSNFDFDDLDDRYVYAATDEQGRIKVGLSKDPERRVKELNVGNAEVLTLVASIKATSSGYQDETNTHNLLERHNIRSEWFASDALLEVKNTALTN